jgi:hypothetical protein
VGDTSYPPCNGGIGQVGIGQAFVNVKTMNSTGGVETDLEIHSYPDTGGGPSAQIAAGFTDLVTPTYLGGCEINMAAGDLELNSTDTFAGYGLVKLNNQQHHFGGDAFPYDSYHAMYETGGSEIHRFGYRRTDWYLFMAQGDNVTPVAPMSAGLTGHLLNSLGSVAGNLFVLDHLGNGVNFMCFAINRAGTLYVGDDYTDSIGNKFIGGMHYQGGDPTPGISGTDPVGNVFINGVNTTLGTIDPNAYSPGSAGSWGDGAGGGLPSSKSEALDRLAAAVSGLLGGPVP